MKTWKRLRLVLVLLLLAALAVNLTACFNVQATDLMEDVSANTVTGKAADEQFVGNIADFSFELFKKTVTDGKNSLISPLSVILALSMTANGADNATLSQMEAVLGGEMSIDDLNEYLYTYVDNLPSEKKSKLTIANSIWFTDDEKLLTVNEDFLQKNADYYHAAAYKSAFDDQTIADINNWVKKSTDGTIDAILDEIPDDAVMYLINAIVFDAEWETIYSTNKLSSGTFNAIDGSAQTADFMYSNESAYLDDGMATGFIKPYANNKYSFVALLPNKGVSIDEYVKSLSGTGFLNTIGSAASTGVSAFLPKFSYEYSIKMNDALSALGMPDAFSLDNADFSKLGKSTIGNIFISDILHKTFIKVDERGTKAGAVTKIEMASSVSASGEIVRLDRPFVYAIIDNATNLPVFIGTVMSLK